MITVEEIKQKTLRRYEEYLRSILLEDPLFFPLEIRGNKENEREKGIGHIQEQLLALYKSDKENTGFGYTLETEKINSKFGKIDSIKKIEFKTEMDFLKFISKEAEVQRIKLLLASTLAEFPELKPLLTEKPNLLSENLGKWIELLKVCSYFRQNPAPGLYIRELPVNVHTKFIEINKGLLASLLSAIIPQQVNIQGESFEDKFHLKTKHNLIRIRFLDSSLSPFPGHEEIGIAETEINTLSITCKRIFIIENDITALTFPKLPGTIAIFGRGYNIASLKGIEWLNPAEIYYWSDIDVQGFEMLSQIRSYFPRVQSFLMDELSFRQFKTDVGIGTKSKNSTPPHLTEQEKMLYHLLSADNLRLEQEKIPQYWVQSQLQILISNSGNSI